MHIDKIIDDLYEGALDPVKWNATIVAIADAVSASGAMLFAFNPATGTLLRSEHHRVDPAAVAEYARYWHLEDIRVPYALTLPAHEPATEQSLGVPLKTSRIYNEFLLPVDTPHFMPAWLHKTDHKVVAISLQGTRRRGPFDNRNIDTLRRLLPHCARALTIKDRLEAADMRCANISNAFDRTGVGVIVLDEKGKILEVSTTASAQLSRSSGLWRDKEGVLCAQHAGVSPVWKWIDTKLQPSTADALLHIPRPGRLPLSILLAPIPTLAQSWLMRDPKWLVLVFDPERALSLTERMIIEDLGLSPRETRVTTLLARALSPQQIAAQLHVSVHTVRTQMKSIFQKTRCHTQAQLIRRVLIGPASIR